MSCLEVPALPLQLLLGQRPEWRELPVVVIAEDRPQGEVTWVNARARAFGIAPGQAYTTALGLARELRASVVPPLALGAGVARALARLRALSPHIEPSGDEPGVFWLDARGLVGLFPSHAAWAEAALAALADEGLEAVVAVGFSRFGTYAAVKSLGVGLAGPSGEARRRVVFASPADERGLADRVPLDHLAIPPRVRERLERLGVRTLGELAALPPAGILKRYGPECHRLQRLARGDLAPALEPAPEVPPARAEAELDFLEHDAHRLLFRIKSLVDQLAPALAARGAVVAELVLALGFEDPAQRERTLWSQHHLRPAAPTLDAALLVDLVRLRLESIDLRRGVTGIRVEARDVAATPDQARLFGAGPRRDTAAAARALARVQAELGEAAVGRLEVRDGHMPKARHVFIAFGEDLSLPPPMPASPDDEDGDAAADPVLVRRLHARAEPIPPRPRELRNDGWPTRDPARGPIVRLHGPFIVSGGWWQAAAGGAREGLAAPTTLGAAVHREYHFAETQSGDLLWIYYDRRRRRWFEEGRVE
ncbi:MAG: DNA polymerase Y family protein [Deltaproteobacteria bacterium]|nr:DNA polymerase Y family protein [Deltaproteobacteria bacterium]